MNNKRAIVSAACLIGIIGVSTTWLLTQPKTASQERNLSDEALLALIKNDQKAFENVIAKGVNIHDALPKIDGKVYTIAEGMSFFERTEFMKHLHAKQVPYIQQVQGKTYDIVSLSIAKNNPDLLEQLSLEKPKYDMAYGKNGLSLLHLAGQSCAYKLVPLLHEKGGLRWDQKAKDGSTPLTLAAENDCLPLLSYWKEQKADFNKKDGRGLTAMAILKKKKEATLMAFVSSFEVLRKPASVNTAEISFYKKRKIPKDQIVDHSALIEPEERPLEATETAEYSEFAD